MFVVGLFHAGTGGRVFSFSLKCSRLAHHNGVKGSDTKVLSAFCTTPSAVLMATTTDLVTVRLGVPLHATCDPVR